MALKVLSKTNQNEIAVFLIDILSKNRNAGLDKYVAYEECKKFINQYSMDNNQYEYYIKFTIDMLEIEKSNN
jgi:hypothetical protein